MSTPDFYPRLEIQTDPEAEDNRMFVATIHDMDSTVLGLKVDHSGPTHTAGMIVLVFTTTPTP